ncbi:hypothetical protein MBCUT_19860 [Methanobrevibacter cuticularis]|uniref:Uncharacterized protein n=1 Tax=Methanobrevibacter cuticularis TaxID=47311 RepID=A0A166CM32_9EURY|nr:hypothetical protein [Methanobrevibacter cuticularis]KZX14654.1 hypothetical protein MBCUT_19860 [Methanobrevibacter cuticularis]
MRKRNFVIFLLLLFVVLLSWPCVFASNFTVGGNDFNDVQSVIDGSSNNDVILLGNKTYTSTSGQIVLLIRKI